MTKVILSICIPTYNRPEHLSEIIKKIISFPSEELEIIISDDNPKSNRTQEMMKKFNDPRIKYFRNKKNLGFDANQLVTFKRATGEFVFLLMDDDEMEMKTTPWIIRTIKKNNNLTYMCGRIIFISDRLYDKNFEIKDKILKKGLAALSSLIFRVAHGSGIVLRKKALNINEAKKYIGFLYIQQAFIAQAMVAGDTLITSKIFARVALSNPKESHLPAIFKGKKYWSSIGHLIIAKYRVQIIYDITKNMREKKKIRKILLNQQKPYIYVNLHETLTESFKDFLNGLFIVITMKKISKSPIFWAKFTFEVMYHFFKSKFYRIYIPKGNMYRFTRDHRITL